jgi:endonuclease/exonuclease/phosphatase (EEP) superfamily protein YafD
MPENKSQSLANHVRYDPAFHFFMAPLALLLLVWALTHAYRHFSHEAVAWVIAALLIVLAIGKARTYALKVQDRVIRLEERLRLANLPGRDVAIPDLTPGQWVALRFASDAELPHLAEKAAVSNLTPKQIKQAIQSWRADYFRV